MDTDVQWAVGFGDNLWIILTIVKGEVRGAPSCLRIPNVSAHKKSSWLWMRSSLPKSGTQLCENCENCKEGRDQKDFMREKEKKNKGLALNHNIKSVI